MKMGDSGVDGSCQARNTFCQGILLAATGSASFGGPLHLSVGKLAYHDGFRIIETHSEEERHTLDGLHLSILQLTAHMKCSFENMKDVA